MSLKGGPELRARLRAIKLSFKPVGREWADETAKVMRTIAPSDTGKGKQTIRRKNATQRRATVAAIYYLGIVDKGSRPHDITAKPGKTLAFRVGGRTVFAKKVHQRGLRGRQFAIRASREALRRHPMAQSLIDQWNRAA